MKHRTPKSTKEAVAMVNQCRSEGYTVKVTALSSFENRRPFAVQVSCYKSFCRGALFASAHILITFRGVDGRRRRRVTYASATDFAPELAAGKWQAGYARAYLAGVIATHGQT
jgi:hypothetical protein